VLKKKIQPTIKQVSEILSYPEEVVAHLVNYSFARLKEEMSTSPKHAKIRIYHLGSFEVSRPALRAEILSTIWKIRQTRTQELIDKLNMLLQLRHKAYAYAKSREFKRRFGTWHYKAAGGPDATEAEES
jgi:hypothetical protein